MNGATPDVLTLPDRRLAYQHFIGDVAKPGIIFLCGYASDMNGTKAEFLDQRCRASNISFLRFDYRGHGQSSGEFIDGTIGDWFDDTLQAFDRLTTGKHIIIGSSMGGWLGLMLSMQRPERVAAFIGIAAAPDFTQDLMIPHLSTEQKEKLARDGTICVPSTPPDAPLPLTQKFLDEARTHSLLKAPIDIFCPVRLLQGMQDEDVPWKHALRIAETIAHSDVRVELIKDGNHRLSRIQDMDVLWKMVEEFI
jgi:pimeloyl-ACP methyl ester carboxylesterase